MKKKNWFENNTIYFNHLEVKNNQLYIGSLNTAQLVKKFGSPLYVYNGDRILENFYSLEFAFFQAGCFDIRIHYAMKANSNLAILKLLCRAGLGQGCHGAWLDCVSPNEVLLGLKAGFPPGHILFTGTSVSNQDLKILVKSKCMINIDSISQLKRLAKIKTNSTRVSLRWNPGSFGAGLHDHTITAGKHVKFGIPEKDILQAFKLAKKHKFNVLGLHQHIGSGWKGNDVNTFLKTVDKTIHLAEKAQQVLGYDLEFVNFGGGPGIPYSRKDKPFPIQKYADGLMQRIFKSSLTAAVAIEPGRYIVGDAGIFLTNINTVEQKGVPIIGVDSGFNALMRPAFYGAYHEIVNCNTVNSKKKKKYMVAGNLCESSDFFNESKRALRSLPVAKEGQVLALLTAGAYGYCMSSNYNLRGKPAEVLILTKKAKLVTKAENFQDVIRNAVK